MKQYLVTGMLLAVVVFFPSCLLANNDAEKPPPPAVNKALRMKCDYVSEEILDPSVWRCQNVEATCYVQSHGISCFPNGTALRSMSDEKPPFSLM